MLVFTAVRTTLLWAYPNRSLVSCKYGIIMWCAQGPLKDSVTPFQVLLHFSHVSSKFTRCMGLNLQCWKKLKISNSRERWRREDVSEDRKHFQLCLRGKETKHVSMCKAVTMRRLGVQIGGRVMTTVCGSTPVWQLIPVLWSTSHTTTGKNMLNFMFTFSKVK